jgi:hypothetical protein
VEEEESIPGDLVDQVDSYFQDRTTADNGSPVEAGAF